MAKEKKSGSHEVAATITRSQSNRKRLETVEVSSRNEDSKSRKSSGVVDCIAGRMGKAERNEQSRGFGELHAQEVQRGDHIEGNAYQLLM